MALAIALCSRAIVIGRRIHGDKPAVCPTLRFSLIVFVKRQEADAHRHMRVVFDRGFGAVVPDLM